MDDESAESLWAVLDGATNPHIVRAFALLRIADYLDSECSSAVLAELTGADEGALSRLLRAAEALGLCTMSGTGRWQLAGPGKLLRTDAEGSMRPWVLVMTAPSVQRAWCELADAVRDGRSTFDQANGVGFWEHLASHPDEQALFDAAMGAGGEARWRAVLAGIGDRRPATVVDVGGGEGRLLAGVLDALPHARGILAERGPALRNAASALADEGPSDRIELVESDFFANVPAGADLYVLCRILHDHADGNAIRILTTCRRAMRPDSRLFVVESVVPPWHELDEDERLALATKDLNMLVLVGGKERTAAEYDALLTEAGLHLERIHSDEPGIDVMVASPT